MPGNSDSDDVARQIADYIGWIRKLRENRHVEHLPPPGAGALASLGHELSLLAEALDRRERELGNLIAAIQTIEQGLTLDEVLGRIFDGFRHIIPYDRIGCALLSEDGRHVSAIWARSNLGPMQIEPGYTRPLGGSTLEAILATGEPRVINDLAAYLAARNSDATRRIFAEGGRSSLTCPLIVERRRVGFLFFTSGQPGTYTDQHQALFTAIAGQVSTVIEKGHLYHELLQRNRQLADENQGLEARATRDPLTGVLNRGAILSALNAALGITGLHGAPGVIMADVDHFKLVNDTHGHQAGDAVLVEFARRIGAVIRRADRLGRYGSEEFLVVIADTNSEELGRAAERLRQAVADSPIEIGGNALAVTASFGAAMVDPTRRDAAAVIAAADAALYRAKRSGRNRCAIASSGAGAGAHSPGD